MFNSTKLVHLKLSTLWLILPLEKYGQGYSSEQMGVLYLVAGLIIFFIYLNKSLIDMPNWVMISVGCVLTVLSLLIYVVIFNFEDPTLNFSVLLFKEVLYMFSVQLVNLGTVYELLKIAPEHLKSTIIASCGFLYTVLMSISSFLGQLWFNYVYSSETLVDSLGSLVVCLIFLPLILYTLIGSILFILHRRHWAGMKPNYTELREEPERA